MDEDVYLIYPGTYELVEGAAVPHVAMLAVPTLPSGLMSCSGSSSSNSPSGAANQRWPLLQAESQTCCKDAATLISSYECFVALGNTLSLLEGRSEGVTWQFRWSFWFLLCIRWCALQGSYSMLCWFGGFSRLVFLSAHLLFLILGYFYSFPRLHFLLCILFLLPNFLPAIWMLSKIVS